MNFVQVKTLGDFILLNLRDGKYEIKDYSESLKILGNLKNKKFMDHYLLKTGKSFEEVRQKAGKTIANMRVYVNSKLQEYSQKKVLSHLINDENELDLFLKDLKDNYKEVN